MWFNPSDLLKSKPSPPANFANPANYRAESGGQVPLISKTSRISNPLAVEKILLWLASIGEVDDEIINDTLTRCEADPETLAYFLMRAKES